MSHINSFISTAFISTFKQKKFTFILCICNSFSTTEDSFAILVPGLCLTLPAAPLKSTSVRNSRRRSAQKEFGGMSTCHSASLL